MTQVMIKMNTPMKTQVRIQMMIKMNTQVKIQAWTKERTQEAGRWRAYKAKSLRFVKNHMGKNRLSQGIQN